MIIISKKDNKIIVSFVDEPASEDVTGSMVYIKTPNYNILLDCGLSQSNDRVIDHAVNNRKFKEVKSKDVDFVIISHLHADHSLLAPKLYVDGCRGKTIIPQNSSGTLYKMSKDCAKINESDAKIINKQENKNYSPLYTDLDIGIFFNYVEEKPIGEKIYLNDEISFEFIPSGHLLYGCQILLYLTCGNKTETILYTGDIGNNVVDNRFVGKLEKIKKAGIVIAESTYGDKPELKTGKKERKNDLDKLKSVIDMQICQMNGRVLIPSFAQSRCQQLAYMIYQLYKDDENFNYKVYIDSPLAVSIFEEYSLILKEEEKIEFDKMMQWKNLVFVVDSKDSKALVQSNIPCLVISTSGMCQVGRIRHHLKSLVSNPNATILFVGFSTEGSLASMLKDNKRKSIKIDMKDYKIKCNSYSLKSMSGHAPFDQLVDYYTSIQTTKIILHHGSSKAKCLLKEALEERFSKECKTTRVVVANSSLKFTL